MVVVLFLTSVVSYFDRYNSAPRLPKRTGSRSRASSRTAWAFTSTGLSSPSVKIVVASS